MKLTKAVEVHFTESPDVVVRRSTFSMDPNMVKPGKTLFGLDDLAFVIEGMEVRGECAVITLAGEAPEGVESFDGGEGGYVQVLRPDGALLEADLDNARIAQYDPSGKGAQT